MNDYKKQFGIKLKAYRIYNGLSMREICNLVDYCYSNWSKIERGLLNPSIKDVKKWAKTFKLDEDDKQEFIDLAYVACGRIPDDLLLREDINLVMWLDTIRS